MTENSDFSVSTAYVGLGSNLGNSSKLIEAAIKGLQEVSVSPLQQSSLWVTSPVDCPEGSNDFINAVVGLNPQNNETPEGLLSILQAMEIEFGRQHSPIINAPRPLDLDLLVFGQEIRHRDSLILPHPRIHLRRFVLQPFCEIASQLIIPGNSKTVRELLHQLNSDEIVKKL